MAELNERSTNLCGICDNNIEKEKNLVHHGYSMRIKLFIVRVVQTHKGCYLLRKHTKIHKELFGQSERRLNRKIRESGNSAEQGICKSCSEQYKNQSN